MPKVGLVGTKMWMGFLEEYNRATVHDVQAAEASLNKAEDTFDGNFQMKKQQIM
jgi:hypothetical protein